MNRFIPKPPLSDFVDFFWFYESYAPPHGKELLLPTGTMELVFDLRFHAAVVVGAHSESSMLDTSQPASVLGVHFKPGGAFPFFKPPAHDLHNLDVPLDLLWGRSGMDLRDRLLETELLENRYSLLENALIEQAARTLQRHPAVGFALEQFRGGLPGQTVGAVSARTGLSSRRFIEVFNEQVGLTPKLYCRVERFQRMLRLLHTSGEIDWTDFALECGYYDQAHFIHDFRDFTGLSPTTYLARRGEHLNHVPIL